MKVTLRPFQEIAVAEVLSRLESAKLGYRGGSGQRQAVGLIAATGAGKTIIATAVIEAILFGSDEFGTNPDPEAVFLWMTDLPELNTQTQGKMLDAGSDLRLDLLPEISSKAIPETLAPGRVYFLNTQKLSAKADLVKKGPLVGRAYTFWDVIRRTIEIEGRTLYLVVDEAHRGMTESKKIEEANSIIQRFIKGYPDAGMPAVPIVLGISATLARFTDAVKNTGRTTSQWDVPADDVRASGLVKDKTIAEFAGEKQRDAMALFPTAVTTWKTATDDWKTYFETYGTDGDEALVVPALIIQVENEAAGKITATDLDALVRKISEIAGTMPDAAFATAARPSPSAAEPFDTSSRPTSPATRTPASSSSRRRSIPVGTARAPRSCSRSARPSIRPRSRRPSGAWSARRWPVASRRTKPSTRPRCISRSTTRRASRPSSRGSTRAATTRSRGPLSPAARPSCWRSGPTLIRRSPRSRRFPPISSRHRGRRLRFEFSQISPTSSQVQA
jgi:hypothetical protein